MNDAAFQSLIENDLLPGWEFDDLLSAPLLRALAGDHLFLQRCAVQIGKLSPINPRPVLRVPKRDSCKARGFFSRGHLARFAALGDETDLSAAADHLHRLRNMRAPDHPGAAWGNAFDYASRGGFFPAGLPTIVWTGLIAESFALAHRLTGDPAHEEMLQGAAQFVLSLARAAADETGLCFAYAPGRPNLIHNSNLIGAATLVRADRSLDIAQAAFAWSLARQNPDGGWFYGPPKTYRWIDNFHTAYVIDALRIGELAGLVPDSAVDRSYRFWITHFFGPDGTPYYYADGSGPRDIQCAAQAIETCCKLHLGDPERFPEALPSARRVAGWTLSHMRKANGAFLYRKGRFLDNRLESVHWGQATMASALGYLQWAEAA